jgi:hypothetical protein
MTQNSQNAGRARASGPAVSPRRDSAASQGAWASRPHQEGGTGVPPVIVPTRGTAAKKGRAWASFARGVRSILHRAGPAVSPRRGPAAKNAVVPNGPLSPISHRSPVESLDFYSNRLLTPARSARPSLLSAFSPRGMRSLFHRGPRFSFSAFSPSFPPSAFSSPSALGAPRLSYLLTPIS